MKVSAILAAVVLGVACLGGCQQQPSSEAPTEETSPAAAAPDSASGASTAAAEQSACSVSAHSGWRATLNTQPGARRTLTIEGRVELPTPGYLVTLERDAAENPAATEPRLTLTLAPPTGAVIQTPTLHPVYYFAPAGGDYSIIHIMCGGGILTDIPVTVVQ